MGKEEKLQLKFLRSYTYVFRVIYQGQNFNFTTYTSNAFL